MSSTVCRSTRMDADDYGCSGGGGGGGDDTMTQYYEAARFRLRREQQQQQHQPSSSSTSSSASSVDDSGSRRLLLVPWRTNLQETLLLTSESSSSPIVELHPFRERATATTKMTEVFRPCREIAPDAVDFSTAVPQGADRQEPKPQLAAVAPQDVNAFFQEYGSAADENLHEEYSSDSDSSSSSDEEEEKRVKQENRSKVSKKQRRTSPTSALESPSCTATANDEKEEEEIDDDDDVVFVGRQKPTNRPSHSSSSSSSSSSNRPTVPSPTASQQQPPTAPLPNPYQQQQAPQIPVPARSAPLNPYQLSQISPAPPPAAPPNPYQQPSAQNTAAPNPYSAPPQQQQPQPQPRPNSRGGRPYGNNKNNADNNNQHHQQQPHSSGSGSSSSWDDCQTNPFQTAREYALANNNDGGQNPSAYNKHRNPYQPPPTAGAAPYQQQNPYAPPPAQPPQNPYAINPYYPQQQQPQPAVDSPPPPQPVIRESLRRKFQPPVKRAGENSNNSSKNNNVRNNSSRNNNNNNNNGMQARPPASNKNRSNDNNSNDNDDRGDDLPEELQRFGKDLVEKIENEIMESGDRVTFADIAGLADQKQTVQEIVCWPLKRPDLFTGLRSAPNGLLLYGPPGTGKTLIGKAIAHESGATFFSISSSSLTSKWIGEGEKLVRVLFAVAAYRNPAVVFIDEIDSLLTQRKADENEASRRIKTEFLVQLDGTGTSGQGRVLVIGATNRPQELDEAARRRFTKRLYIPLPDEGDREILIRVLLQTNNHRLQDEDIRKLARETDGFSGADLKALSTDAAMGPIRQLGARALEVDVADVPPIAYKHFRQALRGMMPSVAPSDLDQYIEWDRTYGSHRATENDEEDDDNDDSTDDGNSDKDDDK